MQLQVKGRTRHAQTPKRTQQHSQAQLHVNMYDLLWTFLDKLYSNLGFFPLHCISSETNAQSEKEKLGFQGFDSALHIKTSHDL